MLSNENKHSEFTLTLTCKPVQYKHSLKVEQLSFLVCAEILLTLLTEFQQSVLSAHLQISVVSENLNQYLQSVAGIGLNWAM